MNGNIFIQISHLPKFHMDQIVSPFRSFLSSHHSNWIASRIKVVSCDYPHFPLDNEVIPPSVTVHYVLPW